MYTCAVCLYIYHDQNKDSCSLTHSLHSHRIYIQHTHTHKYIDRGLNRMREKTVYKCTMRIKMHSFYFQDIVFVRVAINKSCARYISQNQWIKSFNIIFKRNRLCHAYIENLGHCTHTLTKYTVFSLWFKHV